MTPLERAVSMPSSTQRELFELFDKNAPLIIFDIGSCDGIDSLRYKRTFPNSTVYAFEPVPENYQKIQENLATYGNKDIHPFQLALSDRAGKATFHISSAQSQNTVGNKSSSLLEPDKILSIYSWCKFDQSIEVETDTLDHFCVQKKIDHIDFIHIDVQGAELMVLEGATKLLSEVHSLWVEVENISLYKNQPLRKNIQSFMKRHDFILIRYDHGYYTGDQFYVNRKFIEKNKGVEELNKLIRREFWIKLNMPFAGLYRIARKIIKKLKP